MERIRVVYIFSTITQLKRTLELPAFVHQGNILEKYHRGCRFLGLFCYIKHFLPVVVLGIAHHTHLINVVLIMEHKRQGEDDASHSTHHRNSKPHVPAPLRLSPIGLISLIGLIGLISPIKPTQHCGHHRNASQHPERDGKMLATIARSDEAGQACQYDSVGLQIRIELRMPDGSGKEKQDNANQLAPGGFLYQHQTKYEKQGKPP